MTLWDLLFTNQKSAPPEFGLWYVFLPASLLVVGYFSIKYAQSKKLPTLLVLGTVDSSLDHQCLVYSSPHAFDG